MFEFKAKLKKRIIYGAAMGSLFAVTAIAAFFTAKDEVSNSFFTKHLSTILTETEWKQANNITPEEVVPKNPRITNDGEIDVFTYLVVTVPYYKQYVYVEDQNGKTKTVGEGTTNIMTTTPVPMFRFITNSTAGSGDNYNDLNGQLTNLTQQVNEGWKLVSGYPLVKPYKDGEGNDTNFGVIEYVYAYTDTNPSELKPLPVGGNTPTLFDKVKLVNIRENDVYSLENVFSNRPLGVEVQSKSIQTGVGSTDINTVWELLKDD